MSTAPRRSLAALLSQVLVAFTVEFDNEFERRIGEAGHPGTRLSLMVWTNLLRFVGAGVLLRDLGFHALTPANAIKFQLGCLERWGFVVVAAGSERRAGWGSGRGLRGDTAVRLTDKGCEAARIWPPLFDEIEERWKNRFGAARIRELRQALGSVADRPEISLPALLSQALLAFQLEFDAESRVPLVYCANTLRVLGDTPIRVADIPRLTGGSPETTAIGWQLRPYVVVAADPMARRGKVAHLSPRGLRVQEAYHRLAGEIEKRWERKFGEEALRLLRQGLLGLFDHLADGMLPPPGTARAGEQTPALGRQDVGAAARQRSRGLVVQTEAFVRDPAGSLPHYPSWDMNRGFGP